ncbi:hypothetical protein L2811_01785 [Lactobacillus gasseri]|jgi:hypothetical protein|nr:hypothetical protein [Lactobacillus gasseri]MCZ3582424.1 hypothetical protein [Lactobacillus gasseri]MCZ3584211.1 hypothetical protein [Lactobacillus gasseri]MCZ3587824.1 hypothetical protein [Lactobacillus gasseri]MCZ3587835.1 hypothetical protein [Lactobacillus gasseri]
MEANKVHEIIKQCYQDLDYRTKQMNSTNLKDYSAVDENIEVYKQVSLSFSETTLRISILSKELPENSELKEYAKKLIVVLNDGIKDCSETIKALQEFKNLFK